MTTIYRMTMEESRCEAVSPGAGISLLTLRGKSLLSWAKAAHSSGHLLGGSSAQSSRHSCERCERNSSQISWKWEEGVTTSFPARGYCLSSKCLSAHLSYATIAVRRRCSSRHCGVPGSLVGKRHPFCCDQSRALLWKDVSGKTQRCLEQVRAPSFFAGQGEDGIRSYDRDSVRDERFLHCSGCRHCQEEEEPLAPSIRRTGHSHEQSYAGGSPGREPLPSPRATHSRPPAASSWSSPRRNAVCFCFM